MSYRIAVMAAAGLIFAQAAALAVGVEHVAEYGKRVSASGAAGEVHWAGPAAMNDAGQVAMVLHVDPNPRENDDDFKMLVLRDRGPLRLLARARRFEDARPSKDPVDFRAPSIAADGGVICDVELFKKRSDGNTERFVGLWHWRNGKAHQLMTEGERLAGHDEELYPRSWKPVVASGGVVTAHVQLSRKPGGDSYGALVSFKDGKLQLLEHETFGGGGRTNVKYPHLHAAGDHTVVVRKLEPPKGLHAWELCRLVDGRLERFAQYGAVAPEGIVITPGRPTLLGTIGQMKVTPAGRVLVSLRVGEKGNMDIRQALILSDPQFGELRKVAFWGDQVSGAGRALQNLEYHHERTAASDDGHVLFADIDKAGSYFYLAKPDGSVQQIAASPALPGMAGDELRTVWSLGVADGGTALIEVLTHRGPQRAYAWDAKRGVQPLFDGQSAPPRINGGKGRLIKVDRPALVPNALTSGGKWLAAWEGPRGTAAKGLAIFDLTK